jgi:hypothetical protein
MTSSSDHKATTETVSTPTPSAHDAAWLLRAWTATGRQLYDRERATREGHNYATGTDVVAAGIDTLDWLPLPAGGSLVLPFSPGEGIKALVADIGLTQVTRVAWNGSVGVRDDVEHSTSFYGLYGIEAMDDGHPVRVYAVDRGTDLLIVAVDAPYEVAVELDPDAGQVPTH